MQPLVLLLLICLSVIAVTIVLCICRYIDRTQVWVRENDDNNHHHRHHSHSRHRWLPSRNYQTFAQSDLETGPPPSPDHEDDEPQLPLPPGTPPPQPKSGQRSRIPKHPPPRTLYSYRNWDPEDGVIGVTYKSREEEEHGRILDEETARRIEEHERHMDDPSPYDLEGALARGGSLPIAIPTKRTKRPTFPVPQKLIWQKLTPFEKAGAVWWRN